MPSSEQHAQIRRRPARRPLARRGNSDLSDASVPISGPTYTSKKTSGSWPARSTRMFPCVTLHGEFTMGTYAKCSSNIARAGRMWRTSTLALAPEPHVPMHPKSPRTGHRIPLARVRSGAACRTRMRPGVASRSRTTAFGPPTAILVSQSAHLAQVLDMQISHRPFHLGCKLAHGVRMCGFQPEPRGRTQQWLALSMSVRSVCWELDFAFPAGPMLPELALSLAPPRTRVPCSSRIRKPWRHTPGRGHR